MEESKQYFDSIAKEWDTMQDSFFSTQVREKAYAISNMEPGKIAADIGAGTGFIAEGLLKNGLQVIAIDQSPEMLSCLEQKFSDHTNLTCLQGDGEALPLEKETVDYVFANMYLHHVMHPEQTIKELYRILKPGGKLVITDLDEHTHEFLRTEQYDVWLGFGRDVIKQWFTNAGFHDTTIDCVGSNCCADSQTCEDSASISIFCVLGIK